MISIATWPTEFQPTSEVLSHIVKHVTDRVLMLSSRSDFENAARHLNNYMQSDSVDSLSNRYKKIKEVYDDLKLFEDTASKYKCGIEITESDGELNNAYLDSDLNTVCENNGGRIRFTDGDAGNRHLQRIGLVAEQFACYDPHIGPSLIGRKDRDLEQAAYVLAMLLVGFASASTETEAVIDIWTRGNTGSGGDDFSEKESKPDWERLVPRFKAALDKALDKHPACSSLRWKINWHPYWGPDIGDSKKDKEGERYIQIETVVTEWEQEKTICWGVHHNIVDLGAFLLGRQSDYGRGLTKIRDTADGPSARTVENSGWLYKAKYTVTQQSNEFGF